MDHGNKIPLLCRQASGAEDHWAVRDRAARLLGALCRRFGDPFYNVQPRVSRTLLHALLDASMPLTTHYGPVLPCAQLWWLLASLASIQRVVTL